jgi:mRNA-degrading endonuclease toxin of MazEF toxin-antitoxin module
VFRGEIWWAVWPTDPQKKRRPVLIVTNDFRNQSEHLLDITVVKLTSLYREDGSKKSINQFEDVVVKLKKDTIIRCASIFTIEKGSLIQKATTFSSKIMDQVDQQLKNVLSL